MANYLLRACVWLLGSALFLPISCTGALVVGTYINVESDARDLTKGDKPHTRCYIIASTPETDGQQVPISLSHIKPALYDISELCGEKFSGIDTSGYSFLLPNSEGEIREGKWTRYKYHVTLLSPAKQRIEVIYSDDDVIAIFRYIAEEDRIEPLYSKLAAPGYMFAAIPHAWGFAIILYLVGKLLRKKYRRIESKPEQEAISTVTGQFDELS